MALHLDAVGRSRRLEQLQSTLTAACDSSRVELRGSQARDEADLYSDIDLVWHVAAARFGPACDELAHTLGSIDRIESLRWGPEVDDLRRRLVFVRFAEDPLFWRVDLEIQAEEDSMLRSPQPVDQPWSQTHSALMGAVAAIKALLRDDPAAAAGLVSRGFEKIHIPVPGGTVPDQILALVETIYDADDAWALLAARVRDLHNEALADE